MRFQHIDSPACTSSSSSNVWIATFLLALEIAISTMTCKLARTTVCWDVFSSYSCSKLSAQFTDDIIWVATAAWNYSLVSLAECTILRSVYENRFLCPTGYCVTLILRPRSIVKLKKILCLNSSIFLVLFFHERCIYFWTFLAYIIVAAFYFAYHSRPHSCRLQTFISMRSSKS